MTTTVSLTAGLREMIASGRLTEAMIPDDFQWLEASLAGSASDSPPSGRRENGRESADRSIDDLLGEALRRHRHGLIRPLWAEMPEGPEKQRWRDQGRALVDFNDVRESIRNGARRAPKVFVIEGGERARLQAEVERLRHERDLPELEDRRRPNSYFGAETGELRDAIANIIRSNSSPTVERDGFHARNGSQAGYIVYEHDSLPGVLSGILDLFGLVDHPIATIPLNEPVLVFDEGTGDAAIIELRRPGEFCPFGNPRNPRPATHWRRLPPKGKRR